MLAQKIATFTDVGNSLAHVEHLLKDLASFEEKSSVRTGVWVGDRLVKCFSQRHQSCLERHRKW